jgi:hypothetical protein
MTDKSLDELKNAFNVLLDIPHVEVDEVEMDREGNYRVTVHIALLYRLWNYYYITQINKNVL